MSESLLESTHIPGRSDVFERIKLNAFFCHMRQTIHLDNILYLTSHFIMGELVSSRFVERVNITLSLPPALNE